jgi:hypothetical protein
LCSATGSAYPGRAIVALARAGFVAPDELARVARTSTDELLDAGWNARRWRASMTAVRSSAGGGLPDKILEATRGYGRRCPGAGSWRANT